MLANFTSRKALLEVALDPFVLFLLFVMLTPPIRLGYGVAEWARYVFDPWFIGIAAMTTAVVCETYAGRTVRLTPWERFLARWHLLNGAVIHMLLDGLVGVFKVNAAMASQYKLIDKRYGEDLWTDNGAVVHVVSLVELLLKGPATMLLYRAYHRGSAYRDALELGVCLTQAYGTIVYLGHDVFLMGRNFHVDWNLELSIEHLLYFWFAVAFACGMYLVMPGWIGWLAFKRLTAASASYNIAHATVADASIAASPSPARPIGAAIHKTVGARK